MSMLRRRTALLAATALVFTGAAHAQTQPIKVGVTISTTGPAASLGIPQRQSIALLPKEIAGVPLQYVVLDDAADSTKAVANFRKLADEDRADVIIGSSTTPSSMPLIEIAAEKQIPLISLAASARLIAPMDAGRRWVFKVPQNDSLMADAIVEHMVKAKIKTVAFIGFNDGYGDGWAAEFARATKAAGVEVVTTERFARTDASVTGQVLKIMAAKPDAVLVAGSGTPAALPQKTLKERGYRGTIYQTHGIANNDFLRVGGKDVEGTILPAGPILVAAQLPDSNPIKKLALEYVGRYEALNGAGSVATFGAHAYDAGILLSASVPAALQKGKPGSVEFRVALRDALEGQTNLTLTHGIANMTPQDHNGFDNRARVMVTIQNGAWKLLP